MGKEGIKICEAEEKRAMAGLIIIIDAIRQLPIKKKRIGLFWSSEYDEPEDMRDEESRIVARGLLAETLAQHKPSFRV